MVGFRLSMGPLIYSRVSGSNVRVQVLSNAILLEWVPTGVARTSNKVSQNLKPPEFSCMGCVVYPKPQFYMLNDNSLLLFIDVRTRL